MTRRSLMAAAASLLLAAPVTAQAPKASTRADSLAVLALADGTGARESE